MTTMLPASEALYFHNEPVAHIVAHQDVRRMERTWERSRDAIEAVLRYPSDAAFRAALSASNAPWRAAANATIDRGMEPLRLKQIARWEEEARHGVS